MYTTEEFRRRFCISLVMLIGFLSFVQCPVTLATEAVANPEYGHQITVFKDADVGMSIDDAASASMQSRFVAPQTEPLNEGFSDAVLWARIDIVGEPAVPSLLQVAYPLLDEISLYVRQGTSEWLRQDAGDMSPFEQRTVQHRTAIFRLPPTPDGKQTVYVRVHTHGSLQLPIRIWSEVEFFEHAISEYMVLGIYYGVMLVMVLYNLFLYGSVREISYLYYSAFILFSMLVQMSFNGIAFQYLWPEWSWWGNRAAVLLAPFVGLSGIAFARNLLDMREATPRLDRYARWVSLIMLADIAFAVFAPYKLAGPLCGFLSVLFVLAVMPAAIVRFREGYRPAKFFLLAWTLLLAGILITGLLTFGLVPHSLFTMYAWQLGSGLEVVLLSLALADRINLMRIQRTQAQEEILRMASEGKRELEIQVEARTAELSEAKETAESAAAELEKKNALLADLAAHDALTGLYNRRVFIEQLVRALDNAARTGQSVTLVLLDLDHFKAINDTHGHQVGDEVLRGVGRILREYQRVGDCSGRYGGEEFAIMLQGCDEEQGYAAASRIREELMALKLDEAPSVHVTASFGLCSVGADRPRLTVNEIVRCADAALYDAKSAGRNTVHVFAQHRQGDEHNPVAHLA